MTMDRDFLLGAACAYAMRQLPDDDDAAAYALCFAHDYADAYPEGDVSFPAAWRLRERLHTDAAIRNAGAHLHACERALRQ